MKRRKPRQSNKHKNIFGDSQGGSRATSIFGNLLIGKASPPPLPDSLFFPSLRSPPGRKRSRRDRPPPFARTVVMTTRCDVREGWGKWGGETNASFIPPLPASIPGAIHVLTLLEAPPSRVVVRLLPPFPPPTFPISLFFSFFFPIFFLLRRVSSSLPSE